MRRQDELGEQLETLRGQLRVAQQAARLPRQQHLQGSRHLLLRRAVHVGLRQPLPLDHVARDAAAVIKIFY